MKYPVRWIECESCGASHPVGVNQSPGVPQESRCPRCLNVEIARLQRLLAEHALPIAPLPGETSK